MSNQPGFEAHVFVCTNRKERGESCAPRGGAELRDELKSLCSEPSLGLKGRVRINAAGCLGQCERGIAAVIYPQARWFTDLKSTDAPMLLGQIQDALKNGKS